MNTLSLELLLSSLTNLSKQGFFEVTLFFFCALCLLGLVALPLIVLSGQGLARLKQRTAYDKCAKQVAQCACILSWIVTCGGAIFLWVHVGSVLLAPFLQGAAEVTPSATLPTSWPTSWQNTLLFIRQVLEPSTIPMQATALVWITLFSASLLMTFAYAFWRSLRNARLVHQSLLIVVLFWNALALFGTLCILNHHLSLQSELPPVTSLALFFLPEFSSNLWIYFWSVAPYAPTLSVVFSGGLACIWLLLRRTRDDFGRDYYAQMLPWCAAWARNGWFLLWFTLSIIMALHFTVLLREEDFLQNSDFIYGIVYLLLWSIPGILWAIGIRSKTPLRHKVTFLLAFILSTTFLVPLAMDFVSRQ